MHTRHNSNQKLLLCKIKSLHHFSLLRTLLLYLRIRLLRDLLGWLLRYLRLLVVLLRWQNRHIWLLLGWLLWEIRLDLDWLWLLILVAEVVVLILFLLLWLLIENIRLFWEEPLITPFLLKKWLLQLLF